MMRNHTLNFDKKTILTTPTFKWGFLFYEIFINMKKIIRLTESDLTRLITRIVKENREMDYDYSYDIQSVDCGRNIRSGHVDIDDETIVIRYCEGNEEDLEYLKEKGRRLLHSTNSLFEDYSEDDDMSDDYYGMDMEGDDESLDMDPLSQFTPEELNKIYDTVGRLSQPGFFEEDEAESYLFYTVAKEDENLYGSLVDWLERNGLDNPRLRHGYR
jgi:hypothetical protein